MNDSSYPTCFSPVQSHVLLETVDVLDTSAAGFCQRCGVVHRLEAGPAYGYALQLIDSLQRKNSIDLWSMGLGVNSNFSTDYLFGKARGQMFGVMPCLHQDGTLGLLHAFSCQYDGCWELEGWVPPLFDVQKMHDLVGDVEKEIKSLGKQIDFLVENIPAQKKLRCQRRDLSRQLMLEIHDEYRLTNFRGETKKMREVFASEKGIPSGAGDCCAPKLLNYAARHNLTPLGIAEFYWGKSNKSASRKHGEFYSACLDKCAPILGFLLCGLS